MVVEMPQITYQSTPLVIPSLHAASPQLLDPCSQEMVDKGGESVKGSWKSEFIVLVENITNPLVRIGTT